MKAFLLAAIYAAIGIIIWIILQKTGGGKIGSILASTSGTMLGLSVYWLLCGIFGKFITRIIVIVAVILLAIYGFYNYYREGRHFHKRKQD